MKKIATIVAAGSLLFAACGGGGDEDVLEAPDAVETVITEAPADEAPVEDAPATPAAPGDLPQCAGFLELPVEFVVAKAVEFGESCTISGHVEGDRVDEMADALEPRLAVKAPALERSEATINDARTITFFGETEDGGFLSASVSLQPSFEGGDGVVENVTVINLG